MDSKIEQTKFSQVEDLAHGTQMISGVEEVMKTRLELIVSVKQKMCVYADSHTPKIIIEIDAFSDSYKELKERGIKIQFITEITKANAEYCRRMIADSGADLRHSVDPIRGYFLIADGKVLMASPFVRKDRPADQILFSDTKELAEQYQYLFDSLWGRSIPAREVIESVETGRQIDVTEFILDQESAASRVIQILANSKQEVSGMGNEHAPNLIMSFTPYRNAVKECAGRASRARYITNITKANLAACKVLASEFGIEVRHLSGIQTNMILTESEFTSDLSQPHPGVPSTKVLYSNVDALIVQQRQLFDTLWTIAKDSQLRIREIEEGIVAEETRLLTDYAEVIAQGQDFGRSVNSEALILLPSSYRLAITPQVFEIFAKRALEGVRVKILAPFPKDPGEMGEIVKNFPMFRMRSIPPIRIGLMIIDRNQMAIVQYSDVDTKDLSKAISGGIYTTHKQTIASVASIFQTLWKESQLRTEESKIRRQSELLQDILTHDIRNYNQVAKMSAELIKEEASEDPKIASLAVTLLKAIDGSTELVERAKKLGRIITQKKVRLATVDFVTTVQLSLGLIKTAYPGKSILTNLIVEGNSPILVAADDLLLEACDNIITNAVKYSEGNTATIEIRISSAESRAQPYWKIEFADHGKGMSDETRLNAFTRYLSTAKGSGLGLSIVYAIVVERYGGKLKIRNRVQGDRTQGTTVEMWLKKV